MNINRDYLIINDVKKSNITLDNGSMFFYITDKNTQNIFVNLVINVSNNELIQKYANIENAEDYTLTMNIVKPDNDYRVVEGKLHDKEKAIFEFNLEEDCCNVVGPYKCELLTKCNINEQEEITTSNSITYKVKKSVLNDLDDIVEAPEYPLVIQLFDKLSDIEQYEEDRRANELARQLAEEQRQARFDELNADIDNKMADVGNRVSIKEQAVDKLINDTKADIDEYKVAKDQEIDNYKTVKDQEINSAITAQDNKIDTAIANQDRVIQDAITEQNTRLDNVEQVNVSYGTRLTNLEEKDVAHELKITNIEAKDVEQDNRLDSIEAVNVSQGTRLDAIEIKNQQQDDRLLNIEKVNKKQDIDINCLFNLHSVDIEEEGNSVYLQNSTDGRVTIDNIQGNTMVNCNKEPDKEITLNGNINTQGYSNVTLTEGVDGGLVDVALEGNTMVNVCDQKDPVAITKGYTVETGNHVALQGEYDGKCRPVVNGNTLVNLNINTAGIGGNNNYMKNLKLTYVKPNTTYTAIFNIGSETTIDKIDVGITYANGGAWSVYKTTPIVIGTNISVFTTGDTVEPNLRLRTGTSYVLSVSNVILLEGDYTNKPIPGYFEGLQSSFEDKVVTQEMVDNGEELAENLGKYKVDYVISKEDGIVGHTKTLYLNSPLLEGDTIEGKGGNIYHVHRYNKVVLDGSDDEDWRCDGSSDTHTGFFKNTANFNSDLRYNVCVSNKYPTISSQDHWKVRDIEGCIDNTGNIAFLIANNKLSSTDIPSFRVYLQSNPITVIYGLATPQYEVISTNDTILCDSYVNGHLDVDSVVPIEKVDFLPFTDELTYLYASTQYAVQFVSDAVNKVDITLGGAKLLNQDVAVGINKHMITTPSKLIDNKLVVSGVGLNIEKVVVTDTDRDFGYFEGMKSVGECEDLEVVSSNSDGTQSNTQTLTHKPLRSIGDIKDKYILIDGKWYIERNCGVRAYQEGDIDNYITDKINTVYPLETPTYEPIDYNPFEVYSSTTHISNNSTIPCNITIKNTGYNCLLKPSTTYTVSSNLGLNTVTTPRVLTEDCLRFYDTDTSTITKMKDVTILEGDYTTGKPLPSHFSGIESAFEQEYDEGVGKYKVKIRVRNEDASKENYIEFYIDEPLRGIGDAKDKVYVKNDKVVVERKCGQRAYQDGDFGTYLTDKVNTVYQLAEPTYEEVEYNDTKLFIESFKNSTLFYNSNVPVTSKLYYSYSVPIVDAVAQTASISDEQDVMIIDLATQVAVMEMLLM